MKKKDFFVLICLAISRFLTLKLRTVVHSPDLGTSKSLSDRIKDELLAIQTPKWRPSRLEWHCWNQRTYTGPAQKAAVCDGLVLMLERLSSMWPDSLCSQLALLPSSMTKEQTQVIDISSPALHVPFVLSACSFGACQHCVPNKHSVAY